MSPDVEECSGRCSFNSTKIGLSLTKSNLPLPGESNSSIGDISLASDLFSEREMGTDQILQLTRDNRSVRVRIDTAGHGGQAADISEECSGSVRFL